MKKFLILIIGTIAFWGVAAQAQQEPVQIAAMVNNSVITTLDLDARVRFALATSGVPDREEVKRRMMVQVLRGLVDEQLQLQEAARLNIAVTDEEVAAAIANINQQRRLPEGAFEQFLASRDIPIESIQTQAKAQIAWSKVVMQNLRSRVRVSNDEVNRERESIATGKEITEYNLSSLVLPVDSPEQDEETHQLADKLSAEIKEGANFTALASQFSAGGSDLVEQNQYRWVQLHQLEPVLARAVADLEKGGVTSVVRSLTGYHIIKLNDKRTLNLKKVADSEVLLKQIVMKLKETAQSQEAHILLDIAREVGRHPGDCTQEQVAGVEALDDLEFQVKYERLPFKELQPDLQQMLASLRVGDVSEPFATPNGIHLIQLCERVEQPSELPPVDEIKNRIYQQKLMMESTKRLRDLRREALIDVRI